MSFQTTISPQPYGREKAQGWLWRSESAQGEGRREGEEAEVAFFQSLFLAY